MDQSAATLIAAGVAAAASVASLVTNALTSRRAEMRAAQRVALSPHLTELAEGLHGVLATSTLLRKRALNQQDVSEWIVRGRAASDQLKSVRPKLRYILNGLDEPIRVLSRLPEWVATYRDVSESGAEALLESGRKLEQCVSKIVRRTYRRGLPPSRWASFRADRLVKKTRNLWEVRFGWPPPGRLHFLSRRRYWSNE